MASICLGKHDIHTADAKANVSMLLTDGGLLRDSAQAFYDFFSAWLPSNHLELFSCAISKQTTNSFFQQCSFSKSAF